MTPWFNLARHILDPSSDEPPRDPWQRERTDEIAERFRSMTSEEIEAELDAINFSGAFK